MASNHRGGLSRKAAKRLRSPSEVLAWHRRLRFEPLEDRRLLATLTVNTLIDENNGVGVGGVSLREAVAAANTGDTINFSVTGTINLLSTSGGQISIGKSMTIQGPGSSLLTIKAYDPDPTGTNNGNGSRVFFVNDNVFALDVTISGLTLTNGDPTTPDENDGGGAIKNTENLTLSNCVLTGNYAANGGAIYSSANTLTLNDCTISNNTGADGGAILVTGGSLAVTRTTIANNQTSNAGGGILSRSRPVTIVDSTISGNFADEGGGGIYLYGGSLSVMGSTISGNSADANHDTVGPGGGIYNATGSLSISNCTISGNSAGGGGGGVFSNTAQAVSIKFSTITGNVIGNVGGVSGGGINSANAATLDHTIVAGNIQGASTRDDVSGTFNARYSLIGDQRSATVNNTGGSLVGTTAVPIDAKLGLLANNGGPTLTHALLSGSPAIDAGDPTAVAGMGSTPQFDQRGTPFSRVVDFDGVGGARIDMGAVEMAVSGPALIGDYDLNHSVDATDYVLWRKTNNTNVSPAYSGADGDGNGTVNANDYTVWRSQFGKTSPGAGAAAQALNNETMAATASVMPPSSAGTSLPVPVPTATTKSNSRAPAAILQPANLANFDEAASIGLLLVTQRNEKAASVANGRNATEDGASRAAEDAAFEQLAENVELPLLDF